MTRPCSWGQTAIRASLVRLALRITTSVCRSRKLTSLTNVEAPQPTSARAVIARAIRRLMDVAYRIRPLAERIPLPGREGQGPRGGGGRGLLDAPGVREVADQLPGRDHEDGLLHAGRLELLAQRDADLEV